VTTKSARRSVSDRLGGRLARTALALSLAAGLCLGAAACGSSSGGADSITDTYGDGSTSVQQTAVDDFNKTSKVKVDLVVVQGADYTPELRAAMGSSSAPDVFFNWGGGSILPYVQAGQLVNLTSYFNQSPLKGAFLPSIVSAGAVNGRDYGVPMRGMQPVILFYKKALFAQYGLKTPDTWSTMQTANCRPCTPTAIRSSAPSSAARCRRTTSIAR
jgi:xylobiose transport system substrate-binding protein